MTVILLAAGLSERMGCNKLLLPFSGRTIIESTISAIDRAFRTIVVTGHDDERIRETLSGYDVEFVHADDYQKGQRWSTLRGIREVEDDDFAILPGDLPLIESKDIAGTIRLLEKYTIARAYHNGTPGHPVVYRKIHKEALLAYSGTMKEYLSLHDTGIYEGGIGCILDTDTPESYEALQKAGLSRPGEKAKRKDSALY